MRKGGTNTELQKFALVSDGHYTAVLLDGVFIGIGQGVKRIEFSASGDGGTIRLMDLDIERAELSHGTDEFLKFVEGIKKEREISLSCDGKDLGDVITRHLESHD